MSSLCSGWIYNVMSHLLVTGFNGSRGLAAHCRLWWWRMRNLWLNGGAEHSHAPALAPVVVHYTAALTSSSFRAQFQLSYFPEYSADPGVKSVIWKWQFQTLYSLLWKIKVYLVVTPYKVKSLCVTPFSLTLVWLSFNRRMSRHILLRTYWLSQTFTSSAVQIDQLICKSSFFSPALLTAVLFSLSQIILVNLVTGCLKARIALGKTGQNVIWIDWKVWFGLCLCIS